MCPNTKPNFGKKSHLHVHITNTPAADLQFISKTIELFTDPAMAKVAESIRDGSYAVCYSPDGCPAITKMKDDFPATSLDAIAFIQRFSEDQWHELVSYPGSNIVKLLDQSVDLAEVRAKEILGLDELPSVPQLEVANG